MSEWIYFVSPLVIFTASAVFGVKRMTRNQSSEDVSLGFVGLMALGITFTLALAIETQANWMIITERIVGAVVAAWLFGVAIYFRLMRK